MPRIEPHNWPRERLAPRPFTDLNKDKRLAREYLRVQRASERPTRSLWIMSVLLGRLLGGHGVMSRFTMLKAALQVKNGWQ